MNGILVIDKPVGMTSFDVVRWVKKRTGVSRVGHAGTLDPLASGVLVVCVGEATKYIPYLMAADKCYTATVRLGIQTATDDAEEPMQVLHQVPLSAVQALSAEQIRSALTHFVGQIDQIPPRFSALKQQGVPLYRAARSGQLPASQDWESVLQSKTRQVDVFEILLTDVQLPTVTIEVHCGKGVYIRSLARDLGIRLGVGAHLAALRRTRVGRCDLAQALPLGTWLAENATAPLPWLSPKEALGHLPHVALSPAAVLALTRGQLSRIQAELPAHPPEHLPHVLTDLQKDVVGFVEFFNQSWHISRVMHRSS